MTIINTERQIINTVGLDEEAKDKYIVLDGGPEECCKETDQGNGLGKLSLQHHSGWAIAEQNGACSGQRKNVTVLRHNPGGLCVSFQICFPALFAGVAIQTPLCHFLRAAIEVSQVD